MTAAVLMAIFCVHWKIGRVFADPPTGTSVIGQFRYLITPAMALVVAYFGYIARITRAGASLRFRDPEGWTVKLPRSDGDAQILSRDEHHEARLAPPPEDGQAVDLGKSQVQHHGIKAGARQGRIEIGRVRSSLLDQVMFLSKVADELGFPLVGELPGQAGALGHGAEIQVAGQRGMQQVAR